MKTKVIKTLLTIVFLLGCMEMSAYDFEVDGIYYNIISSTEMTCEVTSGDKKYSQYTEIPANVDYNEETWAVTGIGDWAFTNCDFNSFKIPNSVTSIGDWAFANCSYMSHITIPKSVTSIGSHAFWKSFLWSVTIPNSVASIGDDAFYGCKSLRDVIFEDGDETLKLGNSVFTDCPLNSLYLGRNVPNTQNNQFLFDGHGNYPTKVSIGNSVTSIADFMFKDRSGLTSITIPNSVTRIGWNTFCGCSGLTSITIPNSVTSIEGGAFYGCSGLTSVTIPNSVTSIGGGAFRGCSRLTSVTIPNSVTSIGEYMFSDCSRLTNVTIGKSVTRIGMHAFNDCLSLTSIIIPNSVTSIEGYAFEGSGLTMIYSLNPIPPQSDYYGYDFGFEYQKATLYVPTEALEAYKKAKYWKNFSKIVGFDPTGIQGVEVDESIDVDESRGQDVYYDLNGRRLSAPKKGLNIINGKKVIIK